MSYRPGLLTAWLLILCACTPGGDTQPASRGSGAGEAREFIQQVYARYGDNQPGPDILGQDADDLFAPRLLSLIRADQQRAVGELGLLDYDPICACQDYRKLSVQRVDVTFATSIRANAEVEFLNDGNPVRLEFTLERETRDSPWRIADIREDGRSLAEFLQEEGGE